jgi:peptidoglycan hydrolase-like protein with peptidoglycan-binding domain
VALQSELFRGDRKLEAAAVFDPSHVVPGETGPHVQKLQLALNRLDRAGLKLDSIYGPGTAAAVLAYKKRRQIVNRSYQTQADNIVAKMTIASLDREIRIDEFKPVSIVPLFPPPTIPTVPVRSGLNVAFAIRSRVGEQRLFPEPAKRASPYDRVECRQRLGGLLRYYAHAAGIS